MFFKWKLLIFNEFPQLTENMMTDKVLIYYGLENLVL